MILANMAWILASTGRRVLVVDWDLEAPGLHRYFYPFLADPELTSSEGLIDFFTDYMVRALTPADAAGAAPPDIALYGVSLTYESFPKGGAIDFIPAGQQGPAYATRVNSFDWSEFYARLGGGPFLETLRASMRHDYDYVLIDSRTGVSDASGICTVDMPDALVVCFTLNTQSIEGAAAVTESILDQRPSLPVFPVPSRVELAEKDKLERERDHFRRRFAGALSRMDAAAREAYWGQVEVLYQPYYAYEEVLATFADRPNQATSLLSAIERITGFVTDGSVRRGKAPPAKERARRVTQYARLPSDQANRRTTGELERLLSETERKVEELSAERPARNLEASLSGEIGGKIVVGSSNIQSALTSGAVLYSLAPGELPTASRRPKPVTPRLGRRPVVFGRTAEIDMALSSIADGVDVEFVGPNGIGKTTLLREVLRSSVSADSGKDIVLLSSADRLREDIGQSLYDTFYATNVPFIPNPVQLGLDLQDVEAFVGLDDVDLGRNDMAWLLDTMPSATFLLASRRRHLWGSGTTVTVKGLSTGESVSLFERDFGRPLIPTERMVVRSLVVHLEGNPLRILQSAGLARDAEDGSRGRVWSLERLGELVTASDAAQEFHEMLIAVLDEDERRVLALLGTISPALLPATEVGELASVSDAASVIDRLVRLHLIEPPQP